MRRLAVAVLTSGLVLARCSSSRPSAQARALAETCNVFKPPSHNITKQIEMVTTLGQKAGDAELAREAARVKVDLKKPYGGDPSVGIEMLKMTERCIQLGALPESDLPTTPPTSSAN